MQQEMERARTTSCIVDHPGLEPCCLDPYVLRTANYAFIDHHGHRGPLEANQHHRPLDVFVQNVCHLTFPSSSELHGLEMTMFITQPMISRSPWIDCGHNTSGIQSHPKVVLLRRRRQSSKTGYEDLWIS